MSAKKPSGSAQGIKSFFAPKTENKKPQPDNILCMDLQESEPAKSMRDPKVNKFFMSQAEKKEAERQEKQKRILEEMMRTKQETDSMLVGAAKEKSEATSSFFTARQSRPVAANVESRVCDLSGEAVEGVRNEPPQAGFPPEQQVGVQAALKQVEQHRQAMLRSSASLTIMRRTAAPVVALPLHEQVLLPSSDPRCDWGAVHFGRSFKPSRSRATGSADPCDSRRYPLAQATLNLRALWLQWVAGNVGALYDPAIPDGNVPFAENVCGQSTALEGSAQVRVLARWLEKWAGKRRASLSRSSTQSKPASRSSSRQSARAAATPTSKRGPASTRKHPRRSRVCSDSESDGPSDADVSEDESEGEWSCEEDDELQDSSDEECGRASRRSSRASASADPHSSPGGEEDEGEALTNVMVLEGPSGSGKSAAVYDCARKLGIRVIEVSASQQRSGSAVKKFIAEAAQSETIMDNMGSALPGGSHHAEGSAGGMSLILFDEVDNVFEEDGDAQLYGAIQQIAGTSKCPILLTTERPLPFFKALHAKSVKFSRPHCHTGAAFMEFVAAAATDATQVATAATAAARGPTSAASIFAPKMAAKAAAQSVSALPAAGAPELTAKEEYELRVLCALCDGDTRAALATLQLLPGMFFLRSFATAPAGAVVDLTDSPAQRRPSQRQDGAVSPTPMRTFAEYLREDLRLDFALWDEQHHPPLRGSGAQAADPRSAVGRGILVPVVQEVSPRVGLCSGGFTVLIRGANFLQARELASPDETVATADVRVFLNGTIACPCALKSDSCIVAYVPAVDQQGVYVFVVEVRARSHGTARSVAVRSDMGGVGSAWIQLLRRNFPPLLPTLTRCSSASSIGIAVTRRAPAEDSTHGAHSDSDADTVVDCSQQSSPSDLIRASSGGKKKVVLGKRLRKAASRADCDSDDDDFELTSDATEHYSPAKRRQHPRASGSVSEEGDRTSAASTPVATSQEDGDNALPPPDTAVLDLCALGGMLQRAMQSALTAVAENSLSDAFLEPVSDFVAPGYSSVVKAPMDLGTIQASLDEGLYAHAEVSPRLPGIPDVAAFNEDMRQMWRNCVLYNGASSPLVRTAYVLSFLFESRLQSELERVAESCSALRWETDRRGAYTIKCEAPLLTLLTIPACDAFASCGKLAKSMSAPKMESLLAQSSRIADAEGETDVPILSEEQALGPERVDETTLCGELLILRAARASAANALEPASFAGLEYEWDEGAAIGSFGLTLPGQAPTDTEQHCAALAALQANSSSSSWACDADILSAFALQVTDATEDEDPLGCAHRTYLPYGASSLALSTPWPSVANNFASYSRFLLGGYLRRATQGNSDALPPPASPYLHHEFKRLAFARNAMRAMGSYVGRPSGKGGASTCQGLLGQQTMPSLCFLPRSLAADIIPLLGAMCRTESENDADAMDQQDAGRGGQPDQAFPSPVSVMANRRRTVRLLCGSHRITSGAAASGTRLTRRSLTGTETHRHQCFTNMKSKLSTHNPEIYHGLIECNRNMLILPLVK